MSQRQFRTLAEFNFFQKAENIVLVGPTGVGKAGLASGLLLKALQNGYRGAFVKAQDLFDEMYASLADRSTRKMLKHRARLDALVIDKSTYRASSTCRRGRSSPGGMNPPRATTPTFTSFQFASRVRNMLPSVATVSIEGGSAGFSRQAICCASSL